MAVLNGAAPPIQSIQLEALGYSRPTIARLQSMGNQRYNLDTPVGKLFELALPPE